MEERSSAVEPYRKQHKKVDVKKKKRSIRYNISFPVAHLLTCLSLPVYCSFPHSVTIHCCSSAHQVCVLHPMKRLENWAVKAPPHSFPNHSSCYIPWPFS